MNWLDRFIKPFQKKEKSPLETQTPTVEPASMNTPLSPVQSISHTLKEERAPVMLQEQEPVLIPEQESEPEPQEQPRLITDIQKKHIFQMIAMFYTPKQIQKYIKTKFSKDITLSTIYHYKYESAYKPMIETYRKKYYSRVEEIPLANKIKRIEKLQSMFDQLEEMNEQNSDIDDKVKLMDEMRDTLSKIQDEVEGKGKVVISDTHVNFRFSQMSLPEFEQYRLGLVEKLERMKRRELVEIEPQQQGA